MSALKRYQRAQPPMPTDAGLGVAPQQRGQESNVSAVDVPTAPTASGRPNNGPNRVEADKHASVQPKFSKEVSKSYDSQAEPVSAIRPKPSKQASFDAVQISAPSAHEVPHFKFSASQMELIGLMSKSEKLINVSATKAQERFFWISDDLIFLCYGKTKTTSAKAKKKIVIAEVNSIIRGQETTTFLKYRKNHKQYCEDNVALSFSLVCEDSTVDIICKELMQTDTWMKGIQLLTEYVKTLPKEIANPPRTRSFFDSLLNRSDEDGKKPDNKVSSVLAAHDFGVEVKHKTSTGNIFSKLFKKSEQEEPPVEVPSSLPPPDNPSVEKPVPQPVPSESPTGLAKLLERDKKEKKSNVHVTSEDKQLFEFVVVVSVKEENNKLVPFISYSFPPANVQKKGNKQIMQSIPLFCFPDIEIIKQNEQIESKTYSFVLTDIDGTRRFGYCRRMHASGSDKRYPTSFCIISSHPCFGLFSEILDTVENRNRINSVAVYSFLKTVLAHPFPERGGTVEVKTLNPKTGKLEELVLSRPDSSDPMIEYVLFDHLLTSLKIDNFLSLFAALLFERRIIFISNDISALSQCAHAAIAILYPFTWQHVFIPVLPKSLLEYVMSPVPFVVGVLSVYKEYILKLPMEEVVIVDLEKNTVDGEDDLKLLPETVTKTLKNSLTQVLKANKKIETKQVADLFLQFFVPLFCNYKQFLKPNDEPAHKTQFRFDTDSFVRTKNKKEKPFFDLFVQCQMFERWMFEKETMKEKNEKPIGPFEQAVQQYSK